MFNTRKAKRIFTNVLDFLTFNRYVIVVYLLSLVIAISLFIMYLITKDLNTYNIVSLYWLVIVPYIIITDGWLSYKDKVYITKLENNLAALNNPELKIDLAALCHNIWSEDIGKSSNNPVENSRASVCYNDLTQEEKDVNMKKASLILDIIKEYV